MKFGVFCANDTNANKITLNFFFCKYVSDVSLCHRFERIFNFRIKVVIESSTD